MSVTDVAIVVGAAIGAGLGGLLGTRVRRQNRYSVEFVPQVEPIDDEWEMIHEFDLPGVNKDTTSWSTLDRRRASAHRILAERTRFRGRR